MSKIKQDMIRKMKEKQKNFMKAENTPSTVTKEESKTAVVGQTSLTCALCQEVL